MRLTYGVAYNSGGDYNTRENKKNSKAYQTWRNMIERCYSDKFHERQPTYKNYSVCDEWLNFQNFAEWFYRNEYSNKGFQISKELLSENNKVYSPSTCYFVPPEINSLLLNRGAVRGDLPQGVSEHKASGRFISYVRSDGKYKYLGLFDTPEEAHQDYVVAKEAYVKEKALEWRGRIDERVFEALMSWTLY